MFSGKQIVNAGSALPRHCSPFGAAPIGSPGARAPAHASRAPVDSVLFDSGTVSIGRFRCPVGDPDFRDSGAIREAAVVVFPRTSVWIRHEGSEPFVADPNVVTLYNRAQRYERFAIDPAGDRCDWFALADPIARELVGYRAKGDTPFTAQRAPSTVALFSRQRTVYARARAGTLALLEGDEEVLAIVAEVLRLAEAESAAKGRRARRAQPSSHRRHRDLAEGARAVIAASVEENRSVADIARALDTSPFHLCRIFREQTGQTMHAYRVGLRMRRAIERLSVSARRRSATLSQVATDVGFASHAHFVRICQRELGVTPARLRAMLRGEGTPAQPCVGEA